jgi:hypothetical protein
MGRAPWNKGLTGVYSAATLAKLSAWQKGRPKRHGHATGAQSPTYMSWFGMVQRCTNPNQANYPRYGGRAVNPVTVEDPRWRKFVNFLADMGVKPPGTSIDRVDNDLGYCKDNCRWATPSEQRANQREKVSV